MITGNEGMKKEADYFAMRLIPHEIKLFEALKAEISIQQLDGGFVSTRKAVVYLLKMWVATKSAEVQKELNSINPGDRWEDRLKREREEKRRQDIIDANTVFTTLPKNIGLGASK